LELTLAKKALEQMTSSDIEDLMQTIGAKESEVSNVLVS